MIKNIDFCQIGIDIDTLNILQSKVKNKQLAISLQQKYQTDEAIYRQLIKIIKLSAIFENFENIAGKAMLILRKLFKIIRWENFSKIQLYDCSLKGMSFVDCNFQGSQMKKVNIVSTVFINCCLDHVLWQSMISLEQKVFIGNNDAIYSIAVSQNGNWIASTSYSNLAISLWDCQKNKRSLVLKEEVINTIRKHIIEFLSNNLLLSSYYFIDYLTKDYVTLTLWNIKSRKKIKTFKNYSLRGNEIQFSIHGLILAVIKQIYMFSLFTGKKFRTIKTRAVFDVQPNFMFLAFKESNQKIIIWNISKWNQWFSISLNQSIISEFIFSSTKNRLAFQKEFNNSYTIEVWDVKEKQVINTITQQEKGKLIFSRDGNLIGIINNRICIYHTQTCQLIDFFPNKISSSINFMEYPDNYIFLASNQKNPILINSLVINKKKIPKQQLKNTQARNAAYVSDGKTLLIQQDGNKLGLMNLNNCSFVLQNGMRNLSKLLAYQRQVSILLVANNRQDETKIQLFNQKLDQIITQLEYKSTVTSIAISLDGQILAFANVDYSIKLQYFSLYSQLQILKGHEEQILILQFSPNNQILASGDKRKNIKLWDILKGIIILTFVDHQLIFSFSPNSQLFAISYKLQLKLWDIQKRQEKKIISHIQSFSLLKNIIFLHDNIVVAFSDKWGNVWNIEKVCIIKKINYENFSSAIFSQKSQNLVVLDANHIYIYNLYFEKQQKQLYNHQFAIQQLKLFNKEQQVISADVKGGLKFFNYLFQSFLLQPEISSAPHCFTLSASDHLFACGFHDSSIILWNIQTLQFLIKIQSNQRQIRTLEFSNDEQLLVSGSEDGMIVLWDLPSGKKNKVLCKNFSSIIQVAFSINDTKIISCHSNKTIRFWNVQKELQNELGFYQHQHDILSLALSPNQKILAFGSSDCKIYLFDMIRSIIIQKIIVHEEKVNIVAFSKDGKYLASGSDDKTICLVQLRDNSLFEKLLSDGKVTDLAFHNDQKSLIYGNDKGQIYKIALGLIKIKAYQNLFR